MQCSVSVFVLCSCVCVRVHACVCTCVCVHVRACAVQPASSANALWKTNSVSVDSVSRQRSSSDPPAVHPPLPPLRVTSTSTFFSFFLSRCWALCSWMAGGGLSAATRCRLPGAAWGPVALLWPQPCGRCPPSGGLLSASHPTGALHSPALSPEHFSSISVSHTLAPGLPLAIGWFSMLGCVPVDYNLVCALPFSVTCL